MSQDELVEKLKQQVALENIELLLTVSGNYLYSYLIFKRLRFTSDVQHLFIMVLLLVVK